MVMASHLLAQGFLSVSDLQKLEPSQLSLDEKVAIKMTGRPLPDIEISQLGVSNNKRYKRSFNSEWYEKKTWLCGCEVRNALFCFPCLVFGGDTAWTKDGFTNISKMKERSEKHEKSKKHIENVITMSLLGSVGVQARLSEAYKLSIIEHNRKVKKNREILSKIIDCITCCGQFEISLHGHDESGDEKKFESELHKHLESSTVFKGISKTIKNDLLDCLLHVYRDHVKKEIQEASFVAVMADDTTDVSEHTQIVIVLRYVLNGEISERFWGFFNPDNQTADGIAKCILEQLDTILQGSTEKLVAQTFDGAIVMKGKKKVIQAKVKAVYNNAHFIHCYAQQLNLIMKNSASGAQDSRIFFSNLLSIPAFFSRSPQRLSLLNKHIAATVPCPSPTRWDFHSRIVNRVYENLQSLKSCCEEIQATCNGHQTISEATGILHILSNDTFMFWLKLFHKIMPHVEKIYEQMQSQEIDIFSIHEKIANFKAAIQEIRNSEHCKNPSVTLMTQAKELCDCISDDIEHRYSFSKQLVAAKKLFNKKNFATFNIRLPVEEIKIVTKEYPMIDKERLETELGVFFSRPDLHDYDKLIDLLKFILENNLDDVLGEITKLVKVLLTIPMTTTEPERCFSMLKRIKTFLRSTVNQESLIALAVISAEKAFFDSTPNIKEKVINLFGQTKARRMDFTFK